MSKALKERQGAEDAGLVVQLVTFTVGEESFAVEVGSVREIIRLPAITALPNSPGYLDGIINLRGGVIPIVSLRERFGREAAQNDGRTRIMVMTVREKTVGFRVDAVAEVIRVPRGELRPSPLASGGERGCVAGVVERGGRLLIVLAAERLLSDHETVWEAQAA